MLLNSVKLLLGDQLEMRNSSCFFRCVSLSLQIRDSALMATHANGNASFNSQGITLILTPDDGYFSCYQGALNLRETHFSSAVQHLVLPLLRFCYPNGVPLCLGRSLFDLFVATLQERMCWTIIRIFVKQRFKRFNG